MSRGFMVVVGSALLMSAALGGSVAAQDPSAPPAAEAGVVGTGLATLSVPEGTVGVVAAGAGTLDGPFRGERTTILTVVGNGTDAPVHATVAWAAAAADGSLLWAGEVGDSRSSVNDTLLAGSAPGVIEPGGYGLVIASVDPVPDDATWTFAARGEDADDDPVVAIASAALTNGRIAGELVVGGEQPIERGFAVVGVCLGTDGAVTGGNGLYIDVDDPVQPGDGASFDLDLLGAECNDFVVGASGS